MIIISGGYYPFVHSLFGIKIARYQQRYRHKGVKTITPWVLRIQLLEEHTIVCFPMERLGSETLQITFAIYAILNSMVHSTAYFLGSLCTIQSCAATHEICFDKCFPGSSNFQ